MTDGTDEARRTYWAEQMDAAFQFMTAALDVRIEESLEPLASIPDAARDAGVEITFASNSHERGLPRLYYLRVGLIQNLMEVAHDLNADALVLRIEDALRSPEMQANLFHSERVIDGVISKVIWEVGRRPSAEAVYRRLTSLCATIPKTGTHLGGSAIDISVLDQTTGKEIDRGGPYIELSELTPMDSPFVSEAARENRQRITEIFGRHGFVAYPFEFWHYSGGDVYEALLANTNARRVARYGPIQANLSTGEISPLTDITTPLGGKATIMDFINERIEVIWKPFSN